MRGTVKLSIGGVLAGYEEYRDDEHRDRILLYWTSTHHLQDKTHTITIVPDEEEVERAYYAERAKGVYRGRFKRGGNQGAGTAGEPVKEVKVRQPAD
ncbi:hypothetical protein ACTJJB_01780 [Chitinophaga sp. 22536]|uniref:hypothetical protein n=1 Tax=unclassified Chitinophaga TaxID=2619133 RepID=UPI003F867797